MPQAPLPDAPSAPEAAPGPQFMSTTPSAVGAVLAQLQQMREADHQQLDAESSALLGTMMQGLGLEDQQILAAQTITGPSLDGHAPVGPG